MMITMKKHKMKKVLTVLFMVLTYSNVFAQNYPDSSIYGRNPSQMGILYIVFFGCLGLFLVFIGILAGYVETKEE